MKKIIWIFLIAILFSCEDEVIEEQSYAYGIVDQFDQNVDYIAEDSLYNISVEVIDDSRCAIGTVCVWEGKADVEVSIEEPNPGQITLNTYDNQKDTIGNISIELLDVSPYPDINKQVSLSSKIVTLLIEKIN